MAAKRTPAEQRKLNELLSRDHTLNGAILFGLDASGIVVCYNDEEGAQP